MRTLIVYFSLSGNTRHLANTIRSYIPNSELLSIQMKKDREYGGYQDIIRFGYKTLVGIDIPINDVNVDWHQYDTVLLGSPVWLGKVPRPLSNFIKNHKNKFVSKRLFCFVTYGSKLGIYLTQMEKLIAPNGSIRDFIYVNEPWIHNNKNTSRINHFVAKILDKK